MVADRGYGFGGQFGLTSFHKVLAPLGAERPCDKKVKRNVAASALLPGLNHICVIAPKANPSVVHNIARAPRDATRKFQRMLAGKSLGTSSTDGRATAAAPTIATKTAADASAPFQEPRRAASGLSSVAEKIIASTEMASIPK